MNTPAHGKCETSSPRHDFPFEEEERNFKEDETPAFNHPPLNNWDHAPNASRSDAPKNQPSSQSSHSQLPRYQNQNLPTPPSATTASTGASTAASASNSASSSTHHATAQGKTERQDIQDNTHKGYTSYPQQNYNENFSNTPQQPSHASAMNRAAYEHPYSGRTAPSSYPPQFDAPAASISPMSPMSRTSHSEQEGSFASSAGPAPYFDNPERGYAYGDSGMQNGTVRTGTHQGQNDYYHGFDNNHPQSGYSYQPYQYQYFNNLPHTYFNHIAHHHPTHQPSVDPVYRGSIPSYFVPYYPYMGQQYYPVYYPYENQQPFYGHYAEAHQNPPPSFRGYGNAYPTHHPAPAHATSASYNPYFDHQSRGYGGGHSGYNQEHSAGYHPDYGRLPYGYQGGYQSGYPGGYQSGQPGGVHQPALAQQPRFAVNQPPHFDPAQNNPQAFRGYAGHMHYHPQFNHHSAGNSSSLRTAQNFNNPQRGFPGQNSPNGFFPNTPQNYNHSPNTSQTAQPSQPHTPNEQSPGQKTYGTSTPDHTTRAASQAPGAGLSSSKEIAQDAFRPEAKKQYE